MGIKFDRSPTTVIIECTQCPHWRAIALDQYEAYRSAERHLMLVHEVDPHDAAAPRRLWEARQAKRREPRHAADA